MVILIKPTTENYSDDFGYDEYEDDNDEVLLFQQGFEGYPIEIEDGERFEIPNGYIGSINDDNKDYYLKIENEDGEWEKEVLYGDLDSGIYYLNNNVISMVEA